MLFNTSSAFTPQLCRFHSQAGHSTTDYQSNLQCTQSKTVNKHWLGLWLCMQLSCSNHWTITPNLCKLNINLVLWLFYVHQSYYGCFGMWVSLSQTTFLPILWVELHLNLNIDCHRVHEQVKCLNSGKSEMLDLILEESSCITGSFK